MNRVFVKNAFTVGLLVMLLAVPVYGASVNASVTIPAGSEADGASSVNGSITVEEDATVTDTIRTVNGKIRVYEGARIEDASTVNGGLTLDDNVTSESVETVNGSIRIGASSVVKGDVGAVNGRIQVQAGTSVSGNLGNVNGEISLAGAVVDGDVSTVSGDVELSDAARIRGNLVVEKPGMWNWGDKFRRDPTVTIGPGSVVEGNIVLEREVRLFISDTAEVGGVEGVMSMDDAVRFSGDRP